MTSQLPEFEQILREATASVEADLALEDAGWITLGAQGRDVLTNAQRITAVQQSRIYATKDPMGVQSIRLWTDYTFGSGMDWTTKDDRAKAVLEAFWKAPINRPLLSASGQSKSSDKLLIDGEIFFALFLGPSGTATIRTIDPLQITEIITNEDDVEDVRYYRREWVTPQGQTMKAWYSSVSNSKTKIPTRDSSNNIRIATEEAIIYHATINTIGQRGNPLLTSALDWIKLYRRFLASRAAIMLALARFAWHSKIDGGAAAVETAKARVEGETPAAAAWMMENAGSTSTPIKTDSGAANAYQDGRMLKLQVSSATGFPEQYFGDISIGNLATAKTVELPVQKMISKNQTKWAGIYDDIDMIVLTHAGVTLTKPINRDFPPITAEDATAVTEAITQMTTAFPQFLDAMDVQQQALMVMGIKNPNDVLEQIEALPQESMANMPVKIARSIRDFREAIVVWKERQANGAAHTNGS